MKFTRLVSFAIVVLVITQCSSSQTALYKRISYSTLSQSWGSENFNVEANNSSSKNIYTQNKKSENALSSSNRTVTIDLSAKPSGAIFFVTTTEDTGDGSFRRAIENANANAGLDVIQFTIGSGVQTIVPLSPLPDIISPVTIDGTTQLGFTGKPIIQINGSSIQIGLTILAGNSTIKGLVINRCKSSAIYITGVGGNAIAGNFIGTETNGDSIASNFGNGIYINNSDFNTIGGTTAALRNVIGGNYLPDIAVVGSGSVGNKIIGNYIGLNYSGNKGISYSDSSNGIILKNGASKTIIGGRTVAERNIISGHLLPGIVIQDVTSTENSVMGNYIGVGSDPFWSPAIPNGNGIRITAGATKNIIGDTISGSGNLISGNKFPGIVIDGLSTTNNIVVGNIIGDKPDRGYGIGNSKGILIVDAPNNIIGSRNKLGKNIVCGNYEDGMEIRGVGAFGNIVMGNSFGDASISNYKSGIVINNAPRNIIGGPDSLARNIISGNLSHGMIIKGDSATGNIIQQNFIGNTYDWQGKKGNNGFGILLFASKNFIGGDGSDFGNTISFNTLAGIFDSVGTNNRINSNSIFSNGGLGIDLEKRGLTINDSLDTDLGANEQQNFPILDSLNINTFWTTAYFRFDGVQGKKYRIEFFKSDVRSPLFFGDGQKYLNYATLTPSKNGEDYYKVDIFGVITANDFVTATATDSAGNTSEFSRALCVKDSDGDGIYDMWETSGDGIDYNADGKIDLDLYAKGARPNHKDLFVEVDFMDGFLPNDSTLALVRSAFAKVPNEYLNNPDGNNGINLFAELDTSESIPQAIFGDNPWGGFDSARKNYFGTIPEKTDSNARNILAAKKIMYRYAVFANAYGPDANTSSGMARNIPSNDFFVSLGRWEPSGGTVEQQAGTFMHELGHTLGLHHGGNDEIMWKPNYVSVMNYLYQTPRSENKQMWNLNYSPEPLATLDEARVNESIGLAPAPGKYPVMLIPYKRWNGSVALSFLKPSTSVDWDGDGDSSGYATLQVDLNRFNGEAPSLGQVLKGYADWSNIQYDFKKNPNYQNPLPMVSSERQINSSQTKSIVAPTEMTKNDYNYIQTLPAYGIIEPLNQWSTDAKKNIPIETDGYTNYSPAVASDGNGGAFIAWTYVAVPYGGGGDIYMQHLDANGSTLWRNNGIPISTAPVSQDNPRIIADGYGGAIVVWNDSRNGVGKFNVYAQKINRIGIPQWKNNGVPITTLANETEATFSDITSDGHGGAIICWKDNHSGTRSYYTQRIDSAGKLRWTVNGVLISPSIIPGYFGGSNRIVEDGKGGTIVVLEDIRNEVEGDVYIQKLNSAGAIQWGTNGVPVCTVSGYQYHSQINSDDSGGVYVTWQDLRSGKSFIYTQHINTDGKPLLDINGKKMDAGTIESSYPLIVGDGTSGAIIAWCQGNQMRSQRLNYFGTQLWDSSGVILCDTLNLGNYDKKLIPTSSGGAILIYRTTNDLVVQKVDSSGKNQWTKNGVTISNALDMQWFPDAVSDGNNGIIAAWQDKRASQGRDVSQIYAQNIKSNGGLGNDVTTAVVEQKSNLVPQEFQLFQNYPNPFNPTTTINFQIPTNSKVSLKIYDILGREVASLVNEVKSAGTYSTQFNSTRLASGIYFYRIEATSIDGSHNHFVSVKKMVYLK